MSKNLSVFFLLVILIVPLGAVAGYAAPAGTTAEVYHNQEGLAHFKRGFYELTPHQKKVEAAQEFGLAIQEFQQALAINPSFIEAHKNLARVYYIQKKFLPAATHYERVTELNPDDIDSYVLAALAYAEAQKFAEAKAQLESAKQVTTDEQISKKLDEYLEKLEQWEMEASR